MTESTLAAVARAAAEQTASTETKPPVPSQPAAAAPAATAPAAPPAQPAVDAGALAAARQEGAQAERVRAKAILTSEAAQDRGDLAHYFAFDTDMSAEKAVAALEKAPKAAAQEPNGFLAAMRSEPNPPVGSGAAGPAQAKPIATLAERAAARYGVTANAAR